jgi:catechol-2,3-dioxygenase
MPIHRLNHAVLYVNDVARSVAFYQDVLGFRVIDELSGSAKAAFLRAPDSTNDHDLGLFETGGNPPPPGSAGLYHLAWEVDTLDDLDGLAAKLTAAGSLVGASDHGTTKSLYAKDPDGIEFEVVWIVPADALDDAARAGARRPLDIEREKARYGASSAGGVGISR